MVPRWLRRPAAAADRVESQKDDARLTRYSLPWLALIPLVGWEIEAIRRGWPGGPLTHVIRFLLGAPGGVAWWLLGTFLCALLWWAPLHFMFDPVGWRWLIAFVGAGLIVGVVGISVGAMT